MGSKKRRRWRKFKRIAKKVGKWIWLHPAILIEIGDAARSKEISRAGEILSRIKGRVR